MVAHSTVPNGLPEKVTFEKELEGGGEHCMQTSGPGSSPIEEAASAKAQSSSLLGGQGQRPGSTAQVHWERESGSAEVVHLARHQHSS